MVIMKKILSILFLLFVSKAQAHFPDYLLDFTRHLPERELSIGSFSVTTYNPFATTYYIDPAGSDATGTGAIGNPWKTLSKATTSVTTSGDIIHVNVGTYVETVASSLSVGVSIEGSDSSSTIIKNSGVTTEFVEILTMRSSEGTNGNQHISGLQFDGNLVNYWGIYIGGRSNVSIYGCSFKNFINRGIVWGGRNDNVDAAPTIYATGNSFYDNIMNNCADYDHVRDYGAGCINIGGQRGMQIYGNTIINKSRAAGYNGWPIKYYNNGYIDSIRIYDNYLEKAPLTDDLGFFNWDFNIEFFNEQGVYVRNNTLINGGVDLNYTQNGTNVYGALIDSNIITYTTLSTYYQSAIILEVYSIKVTCSQNTITNANSAIKFVPRSGDTVRDILIDRNLSTGSGAGQGTGMFVSFGNGGQPNYYNRIDIYNNTFLEDITRQSYFGIELPRVTAGFIKNINIKNNIIYGKATAGITQQSGSAVTIDSLSIENNDTYACGNSNAPLWSGTTPTHLTVANNLTVLPSFGGSNYSLATGSALIDAGVDVGLPFTGSAPNINYNESTAPPIPTVSAGSDQIITLPSTITLTGSATAGSGASLVSTVWTKISGTTGTITSPTSTTTGVTGMTSSAIFRLTATDNFGGVNYDDVIVIIANPAGCPTLDASQAGTGVTLSGGDLTAVINGSCVLGTVPMIGQKYYEVTINSSPYFNDIGVANLGLNLNTLLGFDAYGWGLYSQNYGSPQQTFWHNSSGSGAYNNAVTAGDVFGVAYNSTLGRMWVWQNSSLIDSLSGITGTVFPAISSNAYTNTSFTINFGATSWAYSPPSGYTGLCNTSTPTSGFNLRGRRRIKFQ